MRRLSCLLFFVCVGSTASAFAQGNDFDAPAGGRSTLMGNTGVALGRDGASPFNNPATIVRILDQRLAFAVHFYSLSLTNFDRWHQPGMIDTDNFSAGSLNGTGLLDSSFESLPSTLCLFFTLEQLASTLAGQSQSEDEDERPTGKKLAICFATLESEEVDIEAVSFRADTPSLRTTQTQALQRRWRRVYIGPTYSVSLNDRFAIGASLHVVYSYDSFGIRSDSLSSRTMGGGVASALATSGSGKSFELTASVGLTYRWERTTFGASLRLPSLHVLGAYDGTFSQTSTGDQALSELADAEGTMRSAPPTRLAFGLGYSGRRWTLELDADVSLPLQNILTAEVDVVTSRLGDMGVDREQTRTRYEIPGYVRVNPSAGFEYFASPGLSLLGGLSTNFTTLGMLKPLASVGNIIQARMNHLTSSLGLGSYGKHGEILFGIQFDYGWGEALAVNPYVIPNNWSVVPMQSYTVTFVIAGSTSLNAILGMVTKIANGGQSGDDKGARKQENPAGTTGTRRKE